MKLSAVQKNDIVRRVRACRYQTQAEALHAAVQLAEEALAGAQPAGDPVAWSNARLRGIASDYFPDAKDWPAAMLCLRHLLMEQSKASPAEARVPLTNEQMIDAIAPLCANRDIAAILVQSSLDEYQAIERAAHGITGGAS